VGGGVGLAVLVVVMAIGAPGGDQPLDPRSHERLGTSALVALLDELGGRVVADDRLPDPDAGAAGPDVTVLLSDRLESDQADRLYDWVASGGTLVDVDPASTFTPPFSFTFDDIDDIVNEGGDAACEISALSGIDVGDIEPRNGGVLYDVPPGSEACIRGALGDAYIVARDFGEGTIVALGGSGLVVNAALAEGENAPVVAALAAPTEGTDVLVLEPGPLAGGEGDRSLLELMSPGVKRALLQLGVACVLYALWRARRLGRPVAEPQPPAVAGSELVAAVGSLLDRSRSTDHAAELLRGDLRRWLSDRVGLPSDTPPNALATVASARTGVDEARLRWALDPRPVRSDTELVELASAIDHIRQEASAHV
jgi:hypothetical protein